MHINKRGDFMIIYTVKSGDTINSIARLFNISPNIILNTNFPPNRDSLVVGQDMVILFPKTVYTVEEGDTLLTIAEIFNTDTYSILRNNPSIIGRSIYPGEAIVIEYEDNPTVPIVTNGYGYTNIDRTILLRALPYLTYFTIFTYGFNNNGDLVYPNDDELIAISKAYGAKPIMHLSTLTENGNFSSELAQLLLNNEFAAKRLIDNIIANIELKGYEGLDIDFEFLPIADRDNYVAFVDELRKRLNENGYILMVALAPKTSTNQRGLLYESHDYYGLGNGANLSLLMTYEWGYTYNHIRYM